ncbi:uncharacterized protein EV422DRAFT_578551 [Fimicolochytrium jonesii]|uniref:uncharacterized protein n=1 Tax=Fimicolochytrium jonesii TaxID=1396493 RepID=UPI0022FDD7B2|nr:uncharacterized protein EV422DRAFT_578551 [Fimicolochytrium jonesii]KAI8820685.1 hypothetical protein EV422DRAFT_578551 [Fimicolochytrium jonesii]
MKLFTSVTVALAVLARVSAQDPSSTDDSSTASSTGTSPATGVASNATGTATGTSAATSTPAIISGGSNSTGTNSTGTNSTATAGNSTISNPLAGFNISATTINPALSKACTDSFLPQLTFLLDPCGLTPIIGELAAIGMANTTVTTTVAVGVIDKILSDKVLTGFCSDACTKAVTSAGSAIATACGTTPLIVSNSTVPSQLSPALAITAGDLAPTINFARQGACVKDAGAFCVISQWTQLKPLVATNATLTVPQASAFICTPCVAKERDAWTAATGLPASLKTPVSDALAELNKSLSACPAGSLVSKDAGVGSHASQMASGAAAALAGAVGLAVGLVG